MSKPKTKCIEEKFTEIFSAGKVFFPKIFRFSAEKLGFLAENYTRGCQIFILWVRGNIFRAKFLKLVFKHFRFFRSIREVSVTTSNNYFKGWQSCKKCLEEQTKEKVNPREKKHYFNFSKNLSEVFLLLAKNYRQGCQNCNLRIFSRFWGKTLFFLNWTWFQPSSDFEMEKKDSSQNVLLRVHATKFRASREIFWGKRFLFRKSLFFCSHFCSLSDFLVFCKVV